MKGTIRVYLLSSCLMANTVIAQDLDLVLEPCINGDVSKTGAFSSQAAEDHYVYTRQQAAFLELEPAVNGDVSASGLFPRQPVEDRQQLEKMNRYGQVE